MGGTRRSFAIDRALVLACAVWLAGCARTSIDAADTSTPTDPRDWEIVLTVNGGFAGLSQRFVATSPAGVLTADDLRRNASGTRMLSTSELRELGALLGHAGAAPATDGAPRKAERGPAISVCADCINYEITIRTRDAFYDAPYDTSNLGGSPDEPLIQRLVELGRPLLADPTTTRNQ